jgi:cytochrome c1
MMQPKINRWRNAMATAALLASVVATGCSTAKTTSASPSNATAAPAEGVSAQRGAQLWADNCVRCHNVRSPSSYSDAHWEVVMLHMRVRANLTEDEQKEILDFLKSAH